MANAALDTIYDAAGISRGARDYLAAKGVTLVSTLGMIADKHEDFYARIVDRTSRAHKSRATRARRPRTTTR